MYIHVCVRVRVYWCVQSPFSPDLKYSGPVAVNTAAMGGRRTAKTTTSASTTAGASTATGAASDSDSGSGSEGEGVLRVLHFEDEETATQTLFRLDDIPTKLPN